jgi:hypothetical protein
LRKLYLFGNFIEEYKDILENEENKNDDAFKKSVVYDIV